MTPILKTAFALCVSFIALVANAETPEAAAEKLTLFLDGLPDARPAYAVTIVTAEKEILSYTRGERIAGSGEAIDADTPFYIASQTKSYLGLLAAKLDALGVLKLDSALADHWPDLRLPDGLDARDWTLRDALTHQIPIEADFIVTTEAYVGALDPADYPSLLARYARKRAPGFRYGNIGYNIYAAILHKKTGRSWRYWLQREVLGPLALKRTAARSGRWSMNDTAWGHVWLGEAEGWRAVPPKTDGVMHSAGGVFASPRDLGRWLQAHLRQRAPQGANFTPEMFAVAHTPFASVDPEARNAYELPCDGYALGWNLCRFGEHRLYIHGGSYTGTRTMMAFSPDLNVGIAVFSNSENMTGWLVSRTIVQYLQYLTDDRKADEMASFRQEQYPQRIAQWLEMQRKQQQDARAKAEWKNWEWRVSTEDLAAYVGRYRGEYAWQTLTIDARPGGLVLRYLAEEAALEPATLDLFGAQGTPLDAPESASFERDASGRVVALEWQGMRFHRVR